MHRLTQNLVVIPLVVQELPFEARQNNRSLNHEVHKSCVTTKSFDKKDDFYKIFQSKNFNFTKVTWLLFPN